MLASKNRVNVALFGRIMKEGVFIGSLHYTLRYVKNGKESRFSAVAAKKIAKLATQRNTIRRKTYAALRLVPTLPLISGVLMAKASVKETSVADLHKDLALLLSKIK